MRGRSFIAAIMLVIGNKSLHRHYTIYILKSMSFFLIFKIQQIGLLEVKSGFILFYWNTHRLIYHPH